MPGVPLPPAVSTCGTYPPWSPSSATTPFCSSVVVPTVTPGVPLQVLPNRVALEACVKHATPAVISRKRAATSSRKPRAQPELAIALETWKEIKFEFDTVDKLDVRTDRFIGR